MAKADSRSEARLMPAVEFQITLDRRELAAILAGLRLLQWANGPDRNLIPFSVGRDVDRILIDDERTGEPLSDAELRELARRLESRETGHQPG